MLYNEAEGKNFQKVYKRIGIRRDRNFSDLSNPTEGLENLLDTLVDVSGTQFLSKDLAAIKNIFARGLTNGAYLNIAGSAVKFTTQNGITASFNPRITYQNRLDKIEIFSGTPRLNGGNGLTAKYFQNDQILFDEHSDFQYNVDPNSTSANVFGGTTADGAINDDNFWEAGNFSYTSNIHPQSAKVNTGVKWEGYFIPSITGTVNFRTQSTGYFSVDFQQVGYKENDDKQITSSGIGTYTEHVRIGLSTAISAISGASGSNEITVSNANLERMNTIGIGMTVVHSNIATNTVIEGFNKTSGVITLTPPAGTASAVTGTISNQSITFKRDLGTSVFHNFTTEVLTAYEKYRIRYRYFHHKNFEAKDIPRTINMDYQQKNQSTSTNLRYTSLYSLDYDFSSLAKGAFNIYFDNSVLFGGTNVFQVLSTDPIGLGNRNDGSKYVKLKSTSKLDVTYKVKQELGSDTGNKTRGIIRRSTSCSTTSGSSVIGIVNGLTTDMEIGNYVFGTGIPANARVIDITINQFVLIDQPATATESNPLTFINHRGFVKRVIVNANVSGSNEIFASASTPLLAPSPDHKTSHTDVQKNMVVIGSNIDAIQITGVTGPSGATGGKLTLASTTNYDNTNITASANDSIYIYQSRGLKDNSLITFCDKLSTTPSVQCLIATSAVPSGNIIPIETTTDGNIISAGAINTNNIGNNNWNIQGFNFASGTKISSIGTNQITLTQNIDKAIVSGTQFTATTNGDDRQLCCPPTDTSPPFTATEEGLNTSVGERPNLRFENGNLVFDQLIIQSNSNSNNIEDSDTYPSAAIDRKINIRTNVNTATGTGKNYKILASSS
tara:strand:+ start:1249 stop:3759 length:2511 start_codon:yes stop_codon:yes gene_type:complete